MSRFDCVKFGPSIEVCDLMITADKDKSPQKVNLGAGVYQTDEGKCWLFPIVRQIAKQVATDEVENKEYYPILGSEDFCKATVELLYGQDSPLIKEGKVFGVQSIGGTSPLSIGAEFLNKHLGMDTVYIPNPSWETHILCFKSGGFKNFREYHYWDAKKLNLDIEGLLTDLENAPANSVIVLHACAHNPTGVDPTSEQWKKLANVIQRRKLYPFFDMAYQGFASGDMNEDAWVVRYFAQRGIEFMCNQSFSKIFAIYGDRAGCLSVVTNNPDNVGRIKSQITLLVRAMYSNPIKQGAKIMTIILNNPEYREEWEACVKIMYNRVQEMRVALRRKLEKLIPNRSWNHVTDQVGMFCYTGLTVSQVKYLVDECHIYLLSNGRINISGLTTKNVEFVAQCIKEAINRSTYDSMK